MKQKARKSQLKKDKFEGDVYIGDSQPALECPIPHDILLDYVKKWDEVFREYHKDSPDGENGLLKSPGVIKGLEERLLKSSDDLPPELYSVIKDFAHSRTITRLQHIREQLKNDQSARSKNLLNHWQE